MSAKLARSIYEVSLLTRLLKARIQLENAQETPEDLNEREILILDLLGERGELRVSDILEYFPKTAASTISSDLAKLGKRRKDGDRLIAKSINEENERERIISLTDEGKNKLAVVKKNRTPVFSTLIRMLALDEEKLKVFEEVLEDTVKRMREELRNPSKG